MTTTEPDDHLVHDAVGPPFTGSQAAAAIAVGVNSLLALGVIPILLGALVDEHRLTASGIGLAAMLELLAMGLTTGLAGMALKPDRLRMIGLLASVALAVFDLGTLWSSGTSILALRAAAGAAEGMLLWITVGMIARTVTPERWAGVFFTAQVAAQLALSLVLGAFVLSRFGANGGFATLAVASLFGAAVAPLTARRYPPLPLSPGEGGAPPLRGWIALVVTLVYVSANGAVSVYLQPLAHQAGLGAEVARTANSMSLAAQVVGAGTATALAGRVRYFTVFLITTAASLIVWWIFGRDAPAWLFISANTAAGMAALFLSPFIVPMTIDADPSRRAGLQSGAAQLFGGALGPLLASFVVGDRDVRGVLWLGAGLILSGMAGVAWLRFTASSEPAPLASTTREA
jgi:hypothetical protein